MHLWNEKGSRASRIDIYGDVKKSKLKFTNPLSSSIIIRKEEKRKAYFSKSFQKQNIFYIAMSLTLLYLEVFLFKNPIGYTGWNDIDTQ